MSRTEALNAAVVDPLGIRWAVARRGDRTYLAWRTRAGTGGVQIRHEHLGIHWHRQVGSAPRGLCWRPLRATWTDLAPAAGEERETAL